MGRGGKCRKQLDMLETLQTNSILDLKGASLSCCGTVGATGQVTTCKTGSYPCLPTAGKMAVGRFKRGEGWEVGQTGWFLGSKGWISAVLAHARFLSPFFQSNLPLEASQTYASLISGVGLFHNVPIIRMQPTLSWHNLVSVDKGYNWGINQWLGCPFPCALQCG